MNTKEVLDTELKPGQSVMAIINETGDTKVIWDRENEVETDAARKQFDLFRSKGYMAYKVEGKDGRKGEVITKFDASAERIIFAPARS